MNLIEKIIFPLLILILYLYKKNKSIGILITIIGLLLAHNLKTTDNYSYLTLSKIYLLLIGSFFLFVNIKNKQKKDYINIIITLFFQLNILCLVATVLNKPFIILLLIISTLTCPTLIIENSSIKMKKNIINNNFWVILVSITLTIYYLSNKDFKEHLYIALFCIWVPLILHFIFNDFVESRALLLCCWILFDIYDEKNKGF